MLVKCRHCRRLCSIEARWCPGCGAPNPGLLFHLAFGAAFLAFLFILVRLVGCDLLVPDSTSEPAHVAKVHVGHTTYFVHDAHWVNELPDGTRPKQRFLSIDISARNDAGKAVAIPFLKLVDGDGTEHEQHLGSMVLPGSLNWTDEVAPGGTRRGLVVFDVAPARSFGLVLDGGYFSEETASVQLTLPPE